MYFERQYNGLRQKIFSLFTSHASNKFDLTFEFDLLFDLVGIQFSQLLHAVV